MLLEDLLPPFVPVAAGTFLMGTPPSALSSLAKTYGGTRESYREESPQQSLYLAAYELATLPVSNRLYAAYVAASAARPPLPWRGPQPAANQGDLPVVDLSWHEAQAFCAWLNERLGRRYRLPSEAEWEKAARGSDGRTFPWGDAWQPERANTREAGAGLCPPGTLANASPYGCLDMAGNVWEWTSSLDAPYPYAADDGREDPQADGRRILRGGCYANPHGFARCACRFRLAPHMRNEFLGLRLAR